MKIKNLFLALLALPLFFVACEETPAVDQTKNPTVKVTPGTAGETSLSFTIESTDATSVAYLVVEGDEAPLASEVLANGKAIETNKSVTITENGLTASTKYTIVAAAQNSKATEKSSATMTTNAVVAPGPDPGTGDEPGDEGDNVEFVATHIYTEFESEEGLYYYYFELGNNTWNSNGWGVDGGTYYCFTVITNSKGNGVLPNGIYSQSESYGANTLAPSWRYRMENGDFVAGYEMYVEANVTITDGKIDANVILSDGSIHHVVFEGNLAVGDGGTQLPTEFEATHTADKWYWGGLSDYGNKYMVSGEGFSVDVHFAVQYAAETTLTAGLYTWSTTTAFGYNDFIDFTTRTFTVNGTSVAVDKGTALVSNEGEEYHIELTLYGRDGFVYMIQYDGKLNDKGEVGETNNNLVVNTLSTGTYNDYYEFYTYKAAGDNFSLDLLLNEENGRASQILAGDYTYASEKAQMNTPGYFYIDNFYFDGIKYKASATSTLSIATENTTNVEITLSIVTTDGSEFVVTYNGLVGGSAGEGGNEDVPAEPTKLATPSVFGNVEGNTVVISWQEIEGAKDYTVTLEGVETKTVTNTYITYSNLAWDTTYNVSVVANSSNEALYISSDAGTASFSTGTQPEDGGDEGGTTGPVASYENWVFSATLDMGTRLVTCTDGSHTLTFTLSEIAGATFSINDGSLRAYDVTVNGVPAESASGTLEMSSASGYCIVLNAYINGVHYTGTSTNPVV